MGTLNLGTGVSLKSSGEYLQQTGTSSPVVSAYVPNQAAQGMTDATWTKNTWLTSETVDSDGAFANSRFTVPTGRAGYYKIEAAGNLYSNNNTMRSGWLAIYKNGSRVAGAYNIVMSTTSSTLRHFNAHMATILDLNAGDYIEVYIYCDVESGALYFSSDSNGIKGNYLLIHKL